VADEAAMLELEALAGDRNDVTLEIERESPPDTWVLEFWEPEETRTHVLEVGQARTVGTGSSVELQVSDRAVSGRHVSLEVSPIGVQVRDLGSKNGLFVGGARVSGAMLVRPDTSFVIGRTTVTLRQPKKSEAPWAEPIPGLVGTSAPMRRLADEVRRYARLSVPALIEGESGSGKELVARSLHQLSGRSGPYVPLNCGSLFESLADSELFGHSRGAFTGAVTRRTGAFQDAHQGTLFLDEIAELAPAVQAKLLRVIEDGEVRPVGGGASERVQARLVSATWDSLDAKVARGEFRADLFHRISTVVLEVPPLRKRKSDIPALSATLLRKMRGDVGEKALTAAAHERLQGYGWPGNVRELRSVLFRAALASEESDIATHHIEAALPHQGQGPKNPILSREEAQRLIAECNGNVSRAARVARVPRSTLRCWLSRGKPEQALPEGD
jgi:DNA-binding NtrC family response regulator